jgi:hypothetical protein
MTQTTLNIQSGSEMQKQNSDAEPEHKNVTAWVEPYVIEFLDKVIEEVDLWDNRSHYARKSINYYLRTSEPDVDVETTFEASEYGSPVEDKIALSGGIRPDTYEEMDVLVSHPHTPWETNQEFLVCAVQNYTEAMEPEKEINRRD